MKKFEAESEATGIQHPLLTMPPLEGEEYLIPLLFEVGPAQGEHELTHGEIRAFQDNTGIELDAFSVAALKTLSRVYLSALHESREPEALPPYRAEATEEQKRAASLAMRNRRRNN